MFLRLTLCGLLLAAAPVAAQPKRLPLAPDLALVPADAAVVAHVKVSDLWKSDALKDVRAMFAKAGADAVAAFDKRFVPVLATVDRLTIYHPALAKDGSHADMKFVGIVSLTVPLDQKKFLTQFGGKPVPRKGKFADFVEDEEGYVAVRFLTPKLVAFGMVEGIKEMCDTEGVKADGPLRATLEHANATSHPVVVGVTPAAVKAGLRNEYPDLQVPEPFRPLFQTSAVTLSVELEGDGRFHLTAAYPDAKAADAAEKALAAATTLATDYIKDTRKTLMEKVVGDGKAGKIEDFPEALASLVGLGALQHAEDVLNAKPVTRRGTDFSMSVPIPPQFKSVVGAAALAGSLTAPAVGKLQALANRMKSQNNLKQIALAMHNYNDAMGTIPPAAICDKQGKPMLSWRVAILPYIEQENLYRQFKLDEPWDSEHNLKLAKTNVSVYTVPGLRKPKDGYTHYQAFVGNGAAFDTAKGISIANFADGTSNTWLVAEAAEGVPWSKPDDMSFDPNKELPKLGNFFKGFNVALCDGSVRFYKKVPQSAKAWITRAGGEVVTDEE